MQSSEQNMMQPKDRIIFPLDCATREEADFYVSLLHGYVGMFKVGLELFVSQGPSIVRKIVHEYAAKVFLDLKFHDIPETVRKAQKAANEYGARFVTVHCDQGHPLLRAVVDVAEHASTGVLAVTVLTSLDREDLANLGIDPGLSVEELVLRRARLAREAGCAGVICSGREVRSIKEALGGEFLAVVPGIRPSWQKVAGDDQKRVVTPAEAVKGGADYIVVGRPIRAADDPVEAARRIAEEIAGAGL